MIALKLAAGWITAAALLGYGLRGTEATGKGPLCAELAGGLGLCLAFILMLATPESIWP